MKKYLILNAVTSSEWDSVEFCLLDLQNLPISKLKELIKLSEKLHKENEIDQIVFYNYSFSFHISGITPPENIINRDFNNIGIIELEDSIYDGLERPENQIRYQDLTISAIGNITFKGFGKHTGEEFWAELTEKEIDILLKNPTNQ